MQRDDDPPREGYFSDFTYEAAKKRIDRDRSEVQAAREKATEEHGACPKCGDLVSSIESTITKMVGGIGRARVSGPMAFCSKGHSWPAKDHGISDAQARSWADKVTGTESRERDDFIQAARDRYYDEMETSADSTEILREFAGRVFDLEEAITRDAIKGEWRDGAYIVSFPQHAVPAWLRERPAALNDAIGPLVLPSVDTGRWKLEPDGDWNLYGGTGEHLATMWTNGRIVEISDGELGLSHADVAAAVRIHAARQAAKTDG